MCVMTHIDKNHGQCKIPPIHKMLHIPLLEHTSFHRLSDVSLQVSSGLEQFFEEQN
jgi:hypothetical protein